MRKLSGAILVSMLGFVLTSSAANAAGRDFCEDYTAAALKQVHLAFDLGCRVDRDNPRWSTVYHVHFDWCRGVSREQADAERDARTDRIRECRDR